MKIDIDKLSKNELESLMLKVKERIENYGNDNLEKVYYILIPFRENKTFIHLKNLLNEIREHCEITNDKCWLINENIEGKSTTIIGTMYINKNSLKYCEDYGEED